MSTATETRTPVEIAREVFGEILNRRDADALYPYWSEDLVETLPTGVYGRDGMHAYFRETFAAIPDFHIVADHIIGEGETVFVKWHLTGTFDGGSWQGIEATGERVEIHGIDCFTIRDGLIVANFAVFDQMSFTRQIGMLPQQNSAAERAMLGAFNARTKLKRKLRGR